MDTATLKLLLQALRTLFSFIQRLGLLIMPEFAVFTKPEPRKSERNVKLVAENLVVISLLRVGHRVHGGMDEFDNLIATPVLLLSSIQSVEKSVAFGVGRS